MPETPEERAVFSDFEGRIWDIFVYSDAGRTEQAKLDFEHIIQTFRMLQ
jgi:hypothetical protein